nr:hypothetical protein GCM10020093_036020 [Planobispora longispora]
MVDFELNDEQRLFRQTLREFVDSEIVPVASEWERTGRYPTEIVERFRQLGLFGMTIPEEYGGLALDRVSFALVFEEIARGWMGVAGVLGSHSLAAWMIAQHGTEEQKKTYLPDLATGARRTGIALTEPGAGTDLQGIQTRAVRDGDHYVVNGTKTWITNARHADPMPVLVKTSVTEPAHRGMSLLLVEAGTPATPSAATCPSSATREPRPARSRWRTCGCRWRTCSAGPRAGECSRPCPPWNSAGSTSPPAPSASPSAPTTPR